MKVSYHAHRRMRQRGFSNPSFEIIQKHGRTEYAPGGAIKIFFGKKERQLIVTDLKKTIQLLDKAQGGTLIVKDNDLITAYHHV